MVIRLEVLLQITLPLGGVAAGVTGVGLLVRVDAQVTLQLGRTVSDEGTLKTVVQALVDEAEDVATASVAGQLGAFAATLVRRAIG